MAVGREVQAILERECPHLLDYLTAAIDDTVKYKELAAEQGVSIDVVRYRVKKLRGVLRTHQTEAWSAVRDWIAYRRSYLFADPADYAPNGVPLIANPVAARRSEDERLDYQTRLFEQWEQAEAAGLAPKPCNPIPPHLRQGQEGSVHHFSGDLSFYLDEWWDIHHKGRRKQPSDAEWAEKWRQKADGPLYEPEQD
jgi:hypothetical protein